MTDNEKKNKIFAWVIFGLLGFLAFREFLMVNILVYVNIEDLWQSKRFIVFLIAAVISLFMWVGYYLWFISGKIEFKVKRFTSSPLWIRSLISAAIIITPSLAKWIIPLPENFLLGAWMMVFSFYVSSLLSVELVDLKDRSGHWFLSGGIFFMLGGTGYSLFSKINLVTAYPFTTYWSEGNRFF